MKLLIDAGNTRIKWAVANRFDDKIVASGILSDDWSILAEFIGEIESAWVSCVAGELILTDLGAKVHAYFAVELHVVKVSASAAGMINNYADLNRLGVDRWLAALGARFLVSKGALVVIDAGTAVTVDLVSAENCFEGGVILPGFAVMHDALLERTAGIESHRQPVASVIGKATHDCVNSGVQYGLIGAIERVVAEICSIVESGSPRLLIMGGDADVIVADTKLDVELQSNMIFYGLMLVSKT